jgi:glutathione peroxidase
MQGRGFGRALAFSAQNLDPYTAKRRSAMSETIENLPLRRIDGKDESLSDYRGRVLLIVNVASKCGFTPQYEGLERLFARFRNRGFAVLGFPANDFAAQEPGTNAEIAQFCTANFGVNFPIFEKITVVGGQKHPLYASLIKAQPKPTTSTNDLRQHLIDFGVTPNEEPEVLWNFEKFLVDRTGIPVARFAPDVEPEDPKLTERIETELSR